MLVSTLSFFTMYVEFVLVDTSDVIRAPFFVLAVKGPRSFNSGTLLILLDPRIVLFIADFPNLYVGLDVLKWLL